MLLSVANTVDDADEVADKDPVADCVLEADTLIVLLAESDSVELALEDAVTDLELDADVDKEEVCVLDGDVTSHP